MIWVLIVAGIYMAVVGYVKRGVLSLMILSAYTRLINWRH